jgi:hypothetical protein
LAGKRFPISETRQELARILDWQTHPRSWRSWRFLCGLAEGAPNELGSMVIPPFIFNHVFKNVSRREKVAAGDEAPKPFSRVALRPYSERRKFNKSVCSAGVSAL